MKTREQAEARALELFPDVKIHKGLPSDELWSEVINDRHQQHRKAYLQCFDDMQKEMGELRRDVKLLRSELARSTADNIFKQKINGLFRWSDKYDIHVYSYYGDFTITVSRDDVELKSIGGEEDLHEAIQYISDWLEKVNSKKH